jgi:hypothetical integral membrane protein (TIGR02206 family)
MNQFFTADYQGAPFAFLGPAHLAALAVIILLNIVLSRFKGASENTRRKIRVALGIILWVNEASYHIWNIYYGRWNIQEHLPLHACSVLIWLAGFMLIFKNYTIYEFAYFMGIGGAIQALLTPDIGIYGFPHFRFFQTFISHGLLVTSAVYLTVVEGMRPTWKSLLKVMVVLNLYMAVVFLINQLIGSNYLFVAHKPYTPSLLDMLPAWPWYIFYIEAIGLVVFLLLYVPFIIKDWRAKRQPT